MTKHNINNSSGNQKQPWLGNWWSASRLLGWIVFDQAVALSCGFYDLITFQNTADPSTTLLF